MQFTASHAPSQPGPSKVRAAQPSQHAPATVKATWDNPVSNHTLDARISGLTGLALHIFLILDNAAGRDKAYCWLGNETLAAMTDKSPRRIKGILTEMEGVQIRRIFIPGDKTERCGFIMLRRAAPGLPAADTPETFRRAEDALTGRRPRVKSLTPPDRSQGEILDTPRVSEISPPGCQGFPTDHSSIEQEPWNDRSRPTDRTILGNGNPSGTQTEATPTPGVRVAMDDADDLTARAFHHRLYDGMEASIASKDWTQWDAAYRGVARDLREGRLTEAQVDQAITLGRKPDTNRRGQRFLGAVRDFKAGRTPKGSKTAPSPPPIASEDPLPAAWFKPRPTHDGRGPLQSSAERMRAIREGTFVPRLAPAKLFGPEPDNRAETEVFLKEKAQAARMAAAKDLLTSIEGVAGKEDFRVASDPAIGPEPRIYRTSSDSPAPTHAQTLRLATFKAEVITLLAERDRAGQGLTPEQLADYRERYEADRADPDKAGRERRAYVARCLEAMKGKRSEHPINPSLGKRS